MVDILPGYIHTLRLNMGMGKGRERDVPCLFYYLAEDLDRDDLPHTILLVARTSQIKGAATATVIIPSVRVDKDGNERINLQDRISIPVQSPQLRTPEGYEWHRHPDFDLSFKKADAIFEVLEEENYPFWVDFVTWEVFLEDVDPRRRIIAARFDIDGFGALEEDFKKTLPQWREYWEKKGK